jgi:hypothetical protein
MGTAAGTVGSTAPGGLAGAASAATPWVTMGLGAVNLATDLIQAGKQQDASRAAEQAAQVAARKEEQLRSQDLFQALQMPMEQYNRAARETTSQVGQAVSALQEGDSRNLAGGLGKIVGAGIEGEAATRDAAAADLFKIGVAQAQSGMNVNSNLANLEADRLAGAQNAAAAAKQAEMGLYSGAAKAGAGLINQGLGMIPSFGENKAAPQNPAQMAQTAAYYNQNAPAMSTGFGQTAPAAPAPQVPFGPQPLIPSWTNSLSFLNKPV